jgi:type III secretory pathway component EscS
LVNCCFSHEFNCFLISLSAREILVSIIANIKIGILLTQKTISEKAISRLIKLLNLVSCSKDTQQCSTVFC